MKISSENIDEVLNLAKRNEQFTYDLEHLRPTMLFLKNDEKAISVYNGNLILTPKGTEILEKGGWIKYKRYLRKIPLNTYQKIYLPFFIFFGLLGAYKVFQPSVKVSDFQNVSYRLDSLISSNKKNKSPRTELLNDTLQTKSSGDLKID